MKKNLKYTLALLLLPFLASAQASMTLRTAKIIDGQKAAHASSLQRGAAMPEEEFGATISVLQGLNVQDIVETGAQVNTVLDGVITLRATPSQLSKIAAVKGVEFIAADNRVYPKLNVAVPLVQADSVHWGEGGLPQAYTGKDVIVGVVDFGFSYTHPTFYDTLGNLRIARVWNQGSKTGTHPQGFSYGAEYTTQPQMEQQQCSSSDGSHGTHVAGIAAGNGGKLKTYKGIAPEANLVLVQLNKGADSEIVDALSYIFSYAGSVGKPAVVNLSLGYHFGPHDGTSTVDRAIDLQTGAGKIVVGAAGNEGSIKLHTAYTFSSNVDTMRTIVGVSSTKDAEVMAWMEIGKHLQWNVEVWDAATKKRLDGVSTSFYSTSTAKGNEVNDKRFLYNSNKDTVIINAAGYDKYSSKTRGIVDVSVRNSAPDKYHVVLALKASSGRVHLWNMCDSDDPAEFQSLNLSSSWVDGSTEYTVGEIGGTAKSIISVGAYVSRPQWTNMQGETWKNTIEKTGHIATFSSLGPTADGRVKPELVAPGCLLVSSVNGCDASYNVSSKYVVAKEPTGNFYYAVMQGTSMAAPVVTGAVALLLQQRPLLTPDSIKCIFMQSAELDTVLSALPNITRGAGLLNALAAMKEQPSDTCCPTIMYTSAIPNAFWGSEKNQLNFSIVPNPNSGVFRVETQELGALTLSVYSLAGALLHSRQVEAGSEISMQLLPQGVYLVRLSSSGRHGVQKMLIYR